MARPGTGEAALARARALFAAHAWRACVELLREADAEPGASGEELLLLGTAAQLIGDDEGAVAAFGRAYRWFLDAGDPRNALQAAFGAGFVLDTIGEGVRARAWAARGRELIERHGIDGIESAMLRCADAHWLVLENRVAEALEMARECERQGLAAGDPDVLVLSRLTIGFGLLLQGRRAEAVGVLDQVMVAISSDETRPAIVGLSYCSSIAGCLVVRDVGRARAWTAALDRWCAARPDLVPFRGTCLVHRAQMSTLGGQWASAVEEARRAEELLHGPPAGAAAYQLAELCRLAGDTTGAEGHYRRANSLGTQPEPGLSRLRIAQGRADAAATTLRRLCAEPRLPEDRAELLAALVEAQLALDDVAGAQRSAAELRELVTDLDAPLLHGLADQADGSVLLAQGRPADAVAALAGARRVWERLDAPHPGAQVRVLTGRCLRALGDEAAAALEFEAARGCFARLGAQADLAALDELDRPDDGSAGTRARAAGGLTDREIEVVRLVAAGHTNRAIAGLLRLSEKTVARHLANIYAKLDVPSRAAATAYAYDHGLL